MKITPEFSIKIAVTIGEFVANPKPSLADFDLGQIAAELNALPLAFNFNSCYAIRPDGEIIVFDLDENLNVAVENDARIQRIALFQGVKKYPQLRELAPIRPTEAIDCSSCNGTGINNFVAENGLDADSIICFCGGSGWLLEGEEINATLLEK